MLNCYGNTICMTRGDFGVPLPIRVTETCQECVDGPLASDVVQMTVARGDMVYAKWERTFAELLAEEGDWVVSLTEEQSKAMLPGRYRWTVALLRDGALRNTLLGPELWEVR